MVVAGFIDLGWMEGRSSIVTGMPVKEWRRRTHSGWPQAPADVVPCTRCQVAFRVRVTSLSIAFKWPHLGVGDTQSIRICGKEWNVSENSTCREN